MTDASPFEAWLQRACAWAGVEVPDAPAGQVTLVPAREDALPVALRWSAGGAEVTVCLEPWSTTLSLGDDDGTEALDLVAAALFGVCRQRRTSAGGIVIGGCVEFYAGQRWKLHARWGRSGSWWRRTSEVTLRNSRVPPFALGDALGLRGAPWAGVSRNAVESSGHPAELPVDGELDLHTFAPKEVAALVEAYIEVCRGRGLTQLRIVHGKGKGQLRRTVHAVLGRHSGVRSFRLGSLGEGSWGATIVDLEPPASG